MDRVLISVTTSAICLSYPELKLSHDAFIAPFVVTSGMLSTTVVVFLVQGFHTFSSLLSLWQRLCFTVSYSFLRLLVVKNFK